MTKRVWNIETRQSGIVINSEDKVVTVRLDDESTARWLESQITETDLDRARPPEHREREAPPPPPPSPPAAAQAVNRPLPRY